MKTTCAVQTDAVLFTRRNEDVRPFEPGGEASLEFFADKADCGLFCLHRTPRSARTTSHSAASSTGGCWTF